MTNMNAKNQYLELRRLLLLRQKIWSKEVLLDFPNSLSDYPEEWLQELAQLSHYDLWKIDARRPLENQNSAFMGHIREIKRSTQLPQKKYQHFLSLPSWAFSRVKQKKQHEISILAQALKDIKNERSFQTLVDIGGGVGHFSRIMAHYFTTPTICVERDARLHELGKQRLEKYPIPKDAGKLDFVALDFQGHIEQERELKTLFQKDHLTLGLHTCGPLAVRHIEAQAHFRAKGLLNFGCCYAKITESKDLCLSQHAKKNPVDLNSYALTLATRSHTEMSYADFCLKEKVKYFRYALALLLKEEFGVDDFVSVGDSPARDYLSFFSRYASQKISLLGLNSTKNPSMWDKFYRRFSTQKTLQKMFHADIIRWQYGRALELVILLDRAVYLEEQGHQVELIEFFDEKLSPRNIGLLAYWD